MATLPELLVSIHTASALVDLWDERTRAAAEGSAEENECSATAAKYDDHLTDLRDQAKAKIKELTGASWDDIQGANL